MVTDPKAQPLVICGLEAGDADLIQRWSGEGYLPTIASVMERGSWGRLTGAEMVSEHGVWVSLFSGVSRGRHGYYYWRPLEPGSYELRLTDHQGAGALPFWSIFRGRRKKAVIVDPSESYPMDGLPGVQLANWAPHNPRFATCAIPSGLLRDLRRRFGPPMYVEEKVDSSPAEDRRIRNGLLKQIAQKGAVCRYLIGLDRFDLIVVTFFESHVAGHQFLKYALGPRKVADAVEDLLSDAVRDVYQAIDRQLKLMLDELPPHVNVFILSNVGLQEDYPNRMLTEEFCRGLGYQVPADSSGASPGPLGIARRVIPAAWRAAASRRLSRGFRELLLAEQFRNGTNWRETSAFPIPSLYTGFLRVNLQGREPEGIIRPGAQYHQLLDRLEDDLWQLVDPEVNRPAVRRVDRTVELFGDDPHPALPDLFVEWTPTPYIKRRVVHPRAVLVQEDLDYERGSHHTHEGFFAAAGPLLQQRGNLGEIDVLDLAPTFLSLADEPIPEHMPGKAIVEIVVPTI